MEIYEGEAVKLGYGFAWRLYDRRGFVVYPIPFNFVARWARSVFFFISRQGYEQDLKKYKLGYEEGFDAGEKYGKETGLKEGYQKRQQELEKAMNDVFAEMKSSKNVV